MADIFEAIKKGDKRQITKILEQWPEIVDKTNAKGATILHFAVLESTKDVVELLLEYGAHINARDRRNWTPMKYAMLAGRDEIYRCLKLKGGIDF